MLCDFPYFIDFKYKQTCIFLLINFQVQNMNSILNGKYDEKLKTTVRTIRKIMYCGAEKEL